MIKSVNHALLVTLFLLLVGSSAWADDTFTQCLELGKASTVRGGKLTSPVPQGWSQAQFSDPRHHDPAHYVYIIRGLGSDLYDLRDLDLGRYADYTWASIISNDVPYTYMLSSGLILAIEPDNVVSNACYDTMFRVTNDPSGVTPQRDQIEADFHRYSQLLPLQDPKQMLWGSLWPRTLGEDEARKIAPSLIGGRYQNNELLLRGQGQEGHIVRTIGVFINKLDDYQPTIAALKEFAHKYDLPIIEIAP